VGTRKSSTSDITSVGVFTFLTYVIGDCSR
jgi:hypothetical protein